MSNIHEDGYRSALLGDRRRQVASTDPATMYARGGIAARVIDIPADLVVSRGVEIEGDDDKHIRGELERLNAMGHLADAIRWSSLDGAAALMLLTDTGTLDEPLPESVGRITEVRVVEYSQLAVAPGGYYDDPRDPTYGQPELYHVRPLITGNYAGAGYFEVHESRLLPIPGEPLPARLKIGATVPWAGRASADAAFHTISRYQRALTLSLEVLKRKQQAVHKMAGLAELIQNGQEQLVRQRVDLVDEVRSLLNGVAVDAEDDYTVYDLNVSGIKDLIAEFQVAVSADSGIPVTALFGRSAAGMNSTGEGDANNLYNMAEGIQRTRAQPALERLVEAITRQNGIQPPGEWSIRWPSLWTPTEKEQAEIRSTNANAVKTEAEARMIDLDTGAVSGEEVRDQMARDGLYGLELSDAD
jgi:phage-related protein (TIGR01555 family)